MWWLTEINDYSETYYPILLEIQRNFRENFTILQWRADIFGGMPLFGDPLSMLLNPINWLSLIVDLRWFFPLAIIISFFIGTVGMRKMLKEFGIKQNIANFYSVVYMIMPMSIAHIKAGHLNIYEAVSFYPWVIYFFKKWTKKDEIRNLFLLAITSVLVLFSHPGMFYILMFILGSVSLYFVIKKRIRIRNYALFCLALIGLGSIYILPTLELNQYISRASLTETEIVPVWTVKSIIGGLSFPYPKISQIDQEAILYPGIILGLMAIHGFLSLKKTKKIHVLLFLSSLFVISLGSFTPIYSLFIKLLPFGGVFRVSSRFWYLALTTIIILSAKGITRLKDKKVVFAIKSLIVFELFLFALLRLSLPGRYGIINDYSFYDKYFKNSANKFRIYSTTHALSQKRIAEVGASLVDGEYPLQLKSYINDLQKAGGYDYLRYSVIQPPYQVYKENPQPDADLLGKLNVLYVVSPYELKDINFKKVDEEKDLILYENSLFKNFLWSDEIYVRLNLYENFGNRVKASFETDVNTTVNWGVRNYPGWEVKVDGKKIIPTESNSKYQFNVIAGRHTLTANFKNKNYEVGLIISFISFFVVSVYLLFINNCFIFKKFNWIVKIILKE